MFDDFDTGLDPFDYNDFSDWEVYADDTYSDLLDLEDASGDSVIAEIIKEWME